MAKSLVIVESPAKSRTINKFLGKDFTVVASMGHIMDLPKKKMGIDIKNNFTPEYVVIPERKKNLAQLKKDLKGKEHIYLAPDPDREGEAISWHLSNLLGTGKKVHRVTFHEITKDAINYSFENPHQIDLNKVNAQQARRVLDRVVGYNLSPLLWKKVGKGLSAGRVQSVALRLIVEREREVLSFKPQEYWEIEALLSKLNSESSFKAKLASINKEKPVLESIASANDLAKRLEK